MEMFIQLYLQGEWLGTTRQREAGEVGAGVFFDETPCDVEMVIPEIVHAATWKWI